MKNFGFHKKWNWLLKNSYKFMCATIILSILWILPMVFRVFSFQFQFWQYAALLVVLVLSFIFYCIHALNFDNTKSTKHYLLQIVKVLFIGAICFFLSMLLYTLFILEMPKYFNLELVVVSELSNFSSYRYSLYRPIGLFFNILTDSYILALPYDEEISYYGNLNFIDNALYFTVSFLLLVTVLYFAGKLFFFLYNKYIKCRLLHKSKTS